MRVPRSFPSPLLAAVLACSLMLSGCYFTRSSAPIPDEDPVLNFSEQDFSPFETGEHLTALVNAINANDVEAARKIVELDRATVSARMADGKTALHWAAPQNRLAIMRILLAAGADPDAVEPEVGAAPLHGCAYGNLVEAATLLLDKGANPNPRFGDDGTTPLHTAASKGNVEVLALLIDRGASVDAVTVKGQTPLHRACAKAHPEAAKILLARGADREALDKWHGTPAQRVPEDKRAAFANAGVFTEAEMLPPGGAPFE